jgi:hypothetical protein
LRKALPEVSGNMLAAAAANRFMTASTIPTEKFPSDDTTTKGEVNAPILEQAIHTAWPMVLIFVVYSSGVDTQVAFYARDKYSH